MKLEAPAVGRSTAASKSGEEGGPERRDVSANERPTAPTPSGPAPTPRGPTAPPGGATGTYVAFPQGPVQQERSPVPAPVSPGSPAAGDTQIPPSPRGTTLPPIAPAPRQGPAIVRMIADGADVGVGTAVSIHVLIDGATDVGAFLCTRVL